MRACVYVIACAGASHGVTALSCCVVEREAQESARLRGGVEERGKVF